MKCLPDRPSKKRRPAHSPKRSARSHRRKKIFLLAAGGAVQKFREKLAEEQEIVAALANIVDGHLRHGIVAASRAESSRKQRRSCCMRDGRRRPRVHLRRAGTRREGSANARSPPFTKATCSSRNSPCCAASASTLRWTRSRCAAASPTLFRRRTAIRSKAANSPDAPGCFTQAPNQVRS